MTGRFDADLIIIGMGSAGMTAAEIAIGLGLRTVAVERARVGGDCLWTGCVPSKALIAAAGAARAMRTAGTFGLTPTDPDVDLTSVWRRVRAVREEIAAGDDDPARFVAMGLDLRQGSASLSGPNSVRIEDADGRATTVTARRILLCTGGSPTVPPIPGLREVGYVTNESFFEMQDVPRRLLFLGGGPIALELAQACAQLGVTCTILQRGDRVLPRDEPELTDQLLGVLRDEGVEVCTGVDVVRIEPGPTVIGVVEGVERRWPTDRVVLSAGRTVDTSSLGLDEAGVADDGDGVVVDERGRTSVPTIYAAGDVTGRDLFTHAAAHEAAVAVRDAFFPGRGRRRVTVPWATFTEPALAHAGLTVEDARKRYGRRVRVHRWSLEHNDRAHADAARGAIVLIERRGLLRSRLVGAHVLAPGAGELINELVLAIERRMCVADLGGVVHVYPTVATSVQQLGARAALERAQRYRWLSIWARMPWTRRTRGRGTG